MLKHLLCTLLAASAHAQFTTSDVTVLNFALNLEYLEASFYQCAVSGTPLTLAQIGAGPAPPKVTGCTKVTGLAGSNYEDYANVIAADELAHVKALRATLGNRTAMSPAIDISQGTFNALYQAAMYPTPPAMPDPFDAFASGVNFLIASFIFEDVGVTAYAGAAAGLNSTDVLSAAAKIMGIEAYHAGAIRKLLIQKKLTAVGASTVQAVADKISALRSKVSIGAATPVDDVGISAGQESLFVPTDPNGLTYSRTAAQIIKIVTLESNTGKGGFFPEGLSLSDPTAMAPTPTPTAKPTTAGSVRVGLGLSSIMSAALVAAKLLM